MSNKKNMSMNQSVKSIMKMELVQQKIKHGKLRKRRKVMGHKGTCFFLHQLLRPKLSQFLVRSTFVPKKESSHKKELDYM
jgi:hypothetical protein